MDRTSLGHLGATIAIAGSMLLGCAAVAWAQEGDEPIPEIKAIIEGTWRLIEWHVDGEIIEPPDMEGLWMVHDGWVMATRHRDEPDYESTAGYGEYYWGADTWTYGYERSEDRRGPAADEANLRLTGSIPIRYRTYDISHEGDLLVLTDATGSGLRWEYDIPGETFTLMMIDGPTIRKYRRVE